MENINEVEKALIYLRNYLVFGIGLGLSTALCSPVQAQQQSVGTTVDNVFASGMDELDWAIAQQTSYGIAAQASYEIAPSQQEPFIAPVDVPQVHQIEPSPALSPDSPLIPQVQTADSWSELLTELDGATVSQAQLEQSVSTKAGTAIAQASGSNLGQDSDLGQYSDLSQDLELNQDIAGELEPGKWWLTVYAGRVGDAYLREIIPREWENSYDVGVGVTRVLYDNGRNLSLEAEGNVLQYLGDQYHQELTGAIGLRWHSFPWDNKVDTSFAIGDGLSWHSENSEFEDHVNNDVAQLLNYLFLEFTFARPKRPNAQLVLRLHHRSGVYGLFSGVVGGSNVYNLGLRFRI